MLRSLTSMPTTCDRGYRTPYFAACEVGAVEPDWAGDPVSWLLTYPDTYEIGMSHLGLRLLYSILNKQEDMAAERVYAPWVDMEKGKKRWPKQTRCWKSSPTAASSCRS